jgi:hypothetical protein
MRIKGKRITRAAVSKRVRRLVHALARPLRAAYYGGRRTSLVDALPDPLKRYLGLDDPTAIGSRKIEIGSGPRPQRGYIHVDVARFDEHLEHVAPAWKLPFPEDWADEIVAIHSLEHIHPSMLGETLAEWLRVLRPGGRIQVHVPNNAELMERYRSADVEAKWALNGAILGMACGPEVRDPRQLSHASQHQILFDDELMSSALEHAGYASIRDLTPEVDDFHTDAWRDHVVKYSLVFEAEKPMAKEVARA